MTDRPIIFSAPMVRALLEGRKTMTRRILKPQPEICFDSDGKQLPIGMMHVEGGPLPRVTVGRVITRQQIRFMPGDRLWVRENFAPSYFDNCKPAYAADWTRAASEVAKPPKWTPCIHMPRWASRLTLIVTAVKVERLRDISEADAISEGMQLVQVGGDAVGYRTPHDPLGACLTARAAFLFFFEHLNGCDPVSDDPHHNPYVVAISFSVQKQNIDTLPKAEAA